MLIIVKLVQTKAPHVQLFCPENPKGSGEIRTVYFLSQLFLQNCVILHLLSSSAFSSAISCKIGERWLCSIGSVALVSRRQKNFKTSSGPVEVLVKRDIWVLQQQSAAVRWALLFFWM